MGDVQRGKPLLIFDYDGTLHETMALYKSAVCDAVNRLEQEYPEVFAKDYPENRNRPAAECIPDRRFCSWIGMPSEAMWKDYLPSLPANIRKQAVRRVGDYMNSHIREASRWYPGAEAVLKQLTQDGWHMVLLSNCPADYAEAHWQHYQMDRWFSAFFACGSFQDLPKEDILQLLFSAPEETLARAACLKSGSSVQRVRDLCEKRAALVIGDRASDRKAAEANRLPFIGCAYGYGTEEELAGAAVLLQDVKELPAAVIKEGSCRMLQQTGMGM